MHLLAKVCPFPMPGTLTLASFAGVTDAGLEQIADLTSLLHLDLSQSPVTDKGLRHLAGLKQLQSLDLAKRK